jgi:hypothetical protein
MTMERDERDTSPTWSIVANNWGEAAEACARYVHQMANLCLLLEDKVALCCTDGIAG